MRDNTLAFRARLFSFMAICLMVFNVLGGPLAGINQGSFLGVTPAYAAPAGSTAPAGSGGGGGSGHSVNDIFDQVDQNGVKSGAFGDDTNLGTVVTTAQQIAKTITSVLSIISFVSLLLWVAKLATSAGNPRNRTTALTGILFSGIALALFGGAWVVVNFFWNLLSGV